MGRVDSTTATPVSSLKAITRSINSISKNTTNKIKNLKRVAAAPPSREPSGVLPTRQNSFWRARLMSNLSRSMSFPKLRVNCGKLKKLMPKKMSNLLKKKKYPNTLKKENINPRSLMKMMR